MSDVFLGSERANEIGMMKKMGRTQIHLQVDDDQIYGERLVEKLLNGLGPLPGRAVGAATQHAYNYLDGAVLEGVHGVIFQRKFFDSWAQRCHDLEDMI